MAKTKEELQSEFNDLSKDWYSIYNWKPIGSKTYIDKISSIIINSFSSINLETGSLRKTKPFKTNTHIGTSEIKESNNPILEKRFCRALFNCKNIDTIGLIKDYEVPFKENSKSKLGDIDLLSFDDKNVFIIEAKTKDSSTPILKAILQCYTYTLLVSHIRSAFYKEFCFNTDAQLTPSVLIFADSECEKELQEINKHDDLKKLISILNDSCKKNNIGAIRFFIIVNDAEDLANCIVMKPSTLPKEPFLIFKESFIPKIEEYIFQD